MRIKVFQGFSLAHKSEWLTTAIEPNLPPSLV
jgi:hypothetical protein